MKMTKQEITEFNELYEYVRNDVMGYDKNQALSKMMVLRLKGMKNGKLYENKKQTDKANYTYKLILLTFKLCKSQISSGIYSKTFDSERQKFNYICAIVENNLNDVYMRMKNAKKNEDRTQNVDAKAITHKSAEYKTKTERTSDKLKDLW